MSLSARTAEPDSRRSGPFNDSDFKHHPDTNAFGIDRNKTPARRRMNRNEKRVVGTVVAGVLIVGAVVWITANDGIIPELDTQVLDLGERNGWSFEVHFTNKNQINATYRAPDGSKGAAEVMDAAHGTLLKRGENKYSNLNGLTIGAYAPNYGVCSSEAALLHASASGEWTATSIPMNHLQVGTTGVSAISSNSIARDHILSHTSIGLSCVPNAGINS